jgi:hypothetical protein
MPNWTVEIGGQRKGPFSDDQLKAMAAGGKLAATDKIWNPHGTRWELAGKLPGLFDPPFAATAAGAPGGIGAAGAGAGAGPAVSAAAFVVGRRLAGRGG